MRQNEQKFKKWKKWIEKTEMKAKANGSNFIWFYYDLFYFILLRAIAECFTSHIAMAWASVRLSVRHILDLYQNGVS